MITGFLYAKMPKYKKGVILFIVLGVLMVVVVLTTVILRIISSQSRLSYHQLSRIQAHYAAKAGVVYALEKLRLNNDANWLPTGEYTHTMYKSGAANPGDFNEPDLPNSIQRVDITVYAPGLGVSGTRKVSATAVYTYLP